MKLIVASSNGGKIREIQQVLKPLDMEILSLKDIGYDEPIEESGETFYENAFLKAKAVRHYYSQSEGGVYYLAEDSGLSVDALEGRPGVYSARYAGENATQVMLIDKLLQEMQGLETDKRHARFICCMVLLSQTDEEYVFEGECAGRIADKPLGTNGFGYDPVFLARDYDYKRTMAQLTSEEKNAVSHRGKALVGIKQYLAEVLDSERSNG